MRDSPPVFPGCTHPDRTSRSAKPRPKLPPPQPPCASDLWRCRREEAVRLGPQHIRNGRVKYRQAKNEHRNPVDMDIPLHSVLAETIAAAQSGHLTFLVTRDGKPYSLSGFSTAFKDWCKQANLPHCSAHGLRKALAARLAEGGASPHEIMSITGHRTIGEIERYTKAANQPRLADVAMSKLQ
ncbi:MAG: tyrosine-type recombinase/integrase [Xanthobacteraceae bacterium]